MKDYKAISEKQAELIYQLSKQPNAIGKEWRERVEKLETEIAELEKQVEEQESISDEDLSDAFQAGRDFQIGATHEYHGGEENENPDFKEWIGKYLKLK